MPCGCLALRRVLACHVVGERVGPQTVRIGVHDSGVDRDGARPSGRRVLLFPLAFLLFAIPAGEFLVPVLMDWTADFTVAAIRWSGVPVFREGNHFALPSGNWSIVEACSGIRYLVASVMIGTIYAALAYRSAKRRAALLVASIVVPIVANWL